MTDRSTGRSRGFAFVTMATPEGAQAAIQGMAGKDLKGRALTVNEARPREERSGGGGGGGGRGGYGDRRGGGGGGGAAFALLTPCLQAGRKSGERAPPASYTLACARQLPELRKELLAVEEPIEIEGTVSTVLPGTMFRVKLDNGHEILAHLSGKMRKHFVRLTVGDRVRLEMSPYDLTKARITYRLR